MSPTLLEALWPRPERWTDLIPAMGVHRAALTMVTYENLAQKPHVDGWLGVSGPLWEKAFRFAIPSIQEVLAMPGQLVLDQVNAEYDRRMAQLEQSHPADRLKNQWSYAIGIADTKISKHPFHFNAVDDLRWKYLPEWEWGTDARVSNYLSMGALRMTDQATGLPCWRAVKGTAGKWAYVDPRSFDTEQQALDCARLIIETHLLTPPGRRTTAQMAESEQNHSQGQK